MKKKRPIRENSSVKVEIVETQDDQTGLVLLEGSQQLQYETATHAYTDDAPSLFKKKKDLDLTFCGHTHTPGGKFVLHTPPRSIDFFLWPTCQCRCVGQKMQHYTRHSPKRTSHTTLWHGAAPITLIYFQLLQDARTRCGHSYNLDIFINFISIASRIVYV